ncbi:MAG TPA: amidohydrolase family protein [Methylomirabilota bacterium]|jgi:N-acyl-D-aspartate/D-glutamate deacylase|nr:amidohydrolase family protein [Methylomirabilota bacterium]
MLDLLIKNARICDGTGTPSFMGDLGVKGRLIRYLGQPSGQTAERVVDADGLALAPGFVDPHTHYDAQIAWDPLLTCSPWHGVTTVIMGNCGVGVAPVKPETREILMHDLVNVEAIPYDVMKAGIDWQWESYGQYLDAIDRRGLGINVAGLVAFTPLRHYVMGEASFERAATDAEIATMRRLLREAIEAGAFGFTTTTSRNHVGYGGRPLACRNASREELAGVVRGLADVGRGAIEIILNSGGMFAVSDEDVELLRIITQASGRPVTWLALFAHPGQPDYHDQTFAKLGDLVKQAVPQVTPRPIMSQGDLRNPTMFTSFLSWQKALNRPAADQIALYRDAAFRQAFQQELESRNRSHMWGQMRVLEVGRSELAPNVGRTIEEIAGSQGKRPVDAYFDLGIADDLETRFQSSTFNFDPAGIERLITDDRCLIGLSDGGAHVDVICDVGYATALLDLWVRKRNVLSLEKAVHKLTQVPARLFGIPDRGVLEEGKVADLVLFDPSTVSAKPPKYAYDLPCNGRRLICESEGIKATYVAGVELYEEGKHTGALPGRILRSYD